MMIINKHHKASSGLLFLLPRKRRQDGRIQKMIIKIKIAMCVKIRRTGSLKYIDKLEISFGLLRANPLARTA